MKSWLTGPLMDEAGADGGGSVAVMDAPNFGSESGEAAVTEAPSDGVLDAEFVDTETQETALAVQPAIVKGERAFQEGKLTQSGKAMLAKVRELSPQLADQVHRSLAMREWMQTTFPEGKRGITDLRTLVEQHGGIQGIKDLKNIADQMTEMDRMYDGADPAFIDTITSSPQGQASFSALMPKAFAKFEQLAPQQFGHQIARGTVKLLDEGAVPTMFTTMSVLLNRAGEFLKKGSPEVAGEFLNKVIDEYNNLHGVIAAIYAASKNAPEVAVAKTTEPKNEDLAKRELGVREKEWGITVTSERQKSFETAMAEATKGRTLTDDQKSNIMAQYRLRIQAKINAWQHNGPRFLQNNDRDGYLREQLNFFRKAIPEAVQQSVTTALGRKPGPAAGQQAAAAPGPSGAILVERMVPYDKVDWTKTTDAMTKQNMAIRAEDGKLVYWK